MPEDFQSLKEVTHIYRGHGCPRCEKTGYKGRTAIVEVLDVNDKVKDIIYSGADLGRVKKVFLEQGMLTLKQDGLIKALQGQTTVEEVLTVTKE